jgi:hypothetical protein
VVQVAGVWSFTNSALDPTCYALDGNVDSDWLNTEFAFYDEDKKTPSPASSILQAVDSELLTTPNSSG